MTSTVSVVGVGGWRLGAEAEHIVAGASLVVGARELLGAYAGAAEVLEWAGGELPLAALRSAESAVVLVRGDAGYFGVLRELRTAGVRTANWPALTDVQRMAAMVGRPWDDIAVVSARGRDFRRAVNVCRARTAVAVLTAPGAGPAELARELDGWRRNLAVLEGVGGAAETLSIVDVSEAWPKVWREPNLVLCLTSLDAVGSESWIAGGEVLPPQGWALDESAFNTREGVGVSAEVRAVALAKLAPRTGVLVWDVCAGSGAVGIEAARLGAAVIAVERDAGLCVRIVANAGAHGVDVRLADGEPSRVVGDLPRPDAVFLRGSRPEVVRACAGSGAERIVVLVPEVDRLGAVRATLGDAGYVVGGCQLSSAGLVPADDGATGLGPAASAFLLWGNLK